MVYLCAPSLAPAHPRPPRTGKYDAIATLTCAAKATLVQTRGSGSSEETVRLALHPGDMYILTGPSRGNCGAQGHENCRVRLKSCLPSARPLLTAPLPP